jgi:hypothetical protein
MQNKGENKMNTLYSTRELKLNRRNLDKALRGVCKRLNEERSSRNVVVELHTIWNDFQGKLFFDTIEMDGKDLFVNLQELMTKYRLTVSVEEWLDQHQTLTNLTSSLDFVTRARNEKREF